MNGAQNYAGIKDPVVDELIETLIAAGDRKELVAATKALDRVLLWNYYVVPHWFAPVNRLVYRNKFGIPEGKTPMKGVQLLSWWVDAEKEKRLDREYLKELESDTEAQKNVFQRLKEIF